MSTLVYLSPNTKEPFTTSKVIAEMTGIEHRKIKAAIRKRQGDINSFGLSTSYQAESSGGRPEEIIKLNEQQATFLMTLLKNTPVVVEFKKELVRQFFAMREELRNVKAVKEERRVIRAEMTDAIKALPETPHKQFKYAQYSNLAYMAALGKSACQLRQERGAGKKTTASDYLTANEIRAVTAMENRIAVLLEIGMDYRQIKASLSRVQFLPQAGHVAG